MRGIPGGPPLDQDIPPMQISASELQFNEAQKLYILGAKLDNFRTVGPWHHVDSKYLDNIVYRLASPISRPCSRMHDEGAWAAEDKAFRHYPRPVSSVHSEPTRNGARRAPNSAKSNFSLPTLNENGKKNNRKRINRNTGSATSSSESEDGMQRVTRPTVASRGGVDIAEKFENKDYVYGSRSVSEEGLDGIVHRVTKPTVASRGGVDIAAKYENKDYVYGSKNVSDGELDGIVVRLTKPTVASTGGAGVSRKYTDFIIGDKKVTSEEFEDIVNRMTKPTVASRGGVDIADKVPVAYSPPKTTKTNPVVPGLKKKQNRLLKRRVNKQELDDIVNRLNTLTPAYKAKYALNPHVWKDESPKGPAFNRHVMVVNRQRMAA